MIEEQGLGWCSPEEIVKQLKRRRLSNLRHNFIATANLQNTPRQQDVIIVGFYVDRIFARFAQIKRNFSSFQLTFRIIFPRKQNKIRDNID